MGGGVEGARDGVGIDVVGAEAVADPGHDVALGVDHRHRGPAQAAVDPVAGRIGVDVHQLGAVAPQGHGGQLGVAHLAELVDQALG